VVVCEVLVTPAVVKKKKYESGHFLLMREHVVTANETFR
jgi:hypothetical protein